MTNKCSLFREKNPQNLVGVNLRCHILFSRGGGEGGGGGKLSTGK